MSRHCSSILLALALLLPAASLPAQVTRLGAHYGVNLTNGAWDDERLGVQGEGHLVGPLQLSAALSFFTASPGTAWQVYSALRIRGPGKWSFASLGYGPVFSQTSFGDSGVLGLEMHTRHISPFADVYLSHLLDGGYRLGVNVLMGFQAPIPR